METFQNFANTDTWIQVFLPSFAEIGKAEVIKRVRGIHYEKGWYFVPLYGAFGAISPNIL